MELKRIQDKMSDIHNNPSVRSFEAVALSPILYLGAIGYFAGSVAVEAARPIGEKVKLSFKSLDNNTFHSKRLREKRVFYPNPESIRDSSLPPAIKIDHTITASESDTPIDHEQQGDIL